MTDSIPIIQANNVSLKRKGLKVIDDISITLSPGDFHILLGPNGAGKSTLLNILSGDIDATQGEILFENKGIQTFSLNALAKKRTVLPQLNRLMFPMTVFEVCALGRTPFISSNIGVKLSKKDKGIITKVLKLLELESYKNRDYSRLSGGEKQRVQIARILCQQTPVLFLDEPLNALDIMHQLKVLELFQTMCKEGYSILCVMHDINLSLKYATKLSVLKSGKLLFQGDSEALRNSNKLGEAFDVQSYSADVNQLEFRLNDFSSLSE